MKKIECPPLLLFGSTGFDVVGSANCGNIQIALISTQHYRLQRRVDGNFKMMDSTRLTGNHLKYNKKSDVK